MTRGSTIKARIGALAGIAAATVAVTTAFGTSHADFTAATLPPAWHIHDCAAAPCVWPHAGVAFFPKVLNESLSTYLQDPAECPDATDKALLGGGAPGPSGDGLTGNQPLREGVCQTSTTVIHLKSISLDAQVPDGWTLQGVSAGFATYYMLTAR